MRTKSAIAFVASAMLLTAPLAASERVADHAAAPSELGGTGNLIALAGLAIVLVGSLVILHDEDDETPISV